MKFNVITIFPDIIDSYCSETILGRAQKKKLIKINGINLRDFAEDKHKKTDDTPYGGGPGMVMKPEPIYKALASFKTLKHKNIKTLKQKKTILLSPRGRQFDQRMAGKFSKLKEITFVCGRYEGVDQRVVDYMVDEEISIGPYVLAGGELGALVIIEAISRLLPGVLGNEESLSEETFGDNYQLPITNYQTNSKSKCQNGELEIGNWKLEIFKEYPQYTKPAEFRGWKVPEVLLGGNHGEIERWRRNQNTESRQQNTFGRYDIRVA
ncbi:MAG: tRNA (guanosine(37)-N1)-methyltransferase TrmD [Candidatus Magasanikbacteria bacterium]|nr:tRNA (guanosine(37)-N1)-methyltransferase TrmD [Candidatus Magasanikbacteria bacterium]